ncbi:hypothetical protein [Spiroplasma endosymbiont of Melieria omissa]|uniref:hypothetical protein n=1 Tax=Spiroplasma endosymbiont of Melieria omissa TaxID=3139324 RepID=UPI003CCB16DD
MNINDNLINTIYHEAGHAFINLAKGISLSEEGITIKNNGGGHTMIEPSENVSLLSMISSNLAGKIAEKIMIGKSIPQSASHDIQNILELLDELSKINLSHKIPKILLKQTQETVNTLIENYKTIHLIAIMCIVKKENNKEEIEFIYKYKELPKHIKCKIEQDTNLNNFLNSEFNVESFKKYQNYSFEDFFKYELFEFKTLLNFYPNLKSEANAYENFSDKMIDLCLKNDSLKLKIIKEYTKVVEEIVKKSITVAEDWNNASINFTETILSKILWKEIPFYSQWNKTDIEFINQENSKVSTSKGQSSSNKL